VKTVEGKAREILDAVSVPILVRQGCLVYFYEFIIPDSFIEYLFFIIWNMSVKFLPLRDYIFVEGREQIA